MRINTSINDNKLHFTLINNNLLLLQISYKSCKIFYGS